MIGDKLIKLRKKQGLSQQDVADALEVTRQTVSNWECEQGAPTLDKAKQLSELYHVSLDDLVGNEIEFVTKKTKEISPVLLSMIGKTCHIYCSELYFYEETVLILDINEDWVKIECKRTKENAIFKKETVIKYLDINTVYGFSIMKEGE